MWNVNDDSLNEEFKWELIKELLQHGPLGRFVDED